MKAKILCAGLLALSSAAAFAHGDVRFSVSVGVPAYPYAAPPVYAAAPYYAPQAYVVAPPVSYYYPPVYFAPPVYRGPAPWRGEVRHHRDAERNYRHR